MTNRTSRPTRIAAIVPSLLLLAAACGRGNETAAVRPFSEVQGSEFTFDNDPSVPDRGIFHVTTTEPMICAIVWGETEALGNFNNSLDMNGTGVVEHDVFLPGAEPGRTYFYVVQGTTADGTLYRSELSTFSLPAAESGTPGGESSAENLALGAAIVDVSSEFSDAWSAEEAVDGDLTTEWSSAGDGDDAFITIDLGAEQEIGSVAFLTRSMADGSAITETFWVRADDGERLGPFPAGTPSDPRPADVALTGRVLRFEVESTTGGNTGAIEIQVFPPGTE
jgi:hypothetical protein